MLKGLECGSPLAARYDLQTYHKGEYLLRANRHGSYSSNLITTWQKIVISSIFTGAGL